MHSPKIHGAVLLGHGSRDPGTEAEIRELCAALVAVAPDRCFAHAFLNQEPGLDVAVNALIAAGCHHIRVLPLLVFTGRHMIEDVPAEIARLRALHPAVSIELEPHLFRLPGFSALLADTLNKAPAKETPA
jgi:sirohydrochlorin cobaltochelatase